jgi:hypothetical protein
MPILLTDGKWEEAFKHQVAVVNSFQIAMQEDTRWVLPAFYTAILDLRLIANRVIFQEKNIYLYLNIDPPLLSIH